MMTNQEAIKRIKEHIAIHKYRESHAIHIVEALEMAISALEAQEWMPVSDKMAYISFEEVKEILKKSIDETTNINEALEKTVQFIYSKGYKDGSRRLRIPTTIEPEIVYTSIYECGSDVICFRILGVFSSIETATKAIERELEIEGDYITNYAKETREWEVRYTNGVATYRIEKRVVDSFDN